MLPKFEKSIISAGVTNVPVSNYTYAGFFTCSIKLRGLLEYVHAGLWEYVLIVNDWFWHLSEYWVQSHIGCGKFS